MHTLIYKLISNIDRYDVYMIQFLFISFEHSAGSFRLIPEVPSAIQPVAFPLRFQAFP